MEFNEFKDRANFFHYVNEGPYPDDQEEEIYMDAFVSFIVHL